MEGLSTSELALHSSFRLRIVLSLDSAHGCRQADEMEVCELFSAHGKSNCGDGESSLSMISSSREQWFSPTDGVAGSSAGTEAVVTGKMRGELRAGSVSSGRLGEPNGLL